MLFILAVASNDIFIGTLVYIIIFVCYFFAFAILSSFLVKDKKKAYIFITFMTIVFFYSFTNLLQTSIFFAVASAATCIFFIIVLSVWYRKRNKQ